MFEIDALNEATPVNIRISDFIAKGGQGAVYLGLVNGEKSAVKVYFSGNVQQRVLREIEALEKITCKYVAKLLWKGTCVVDGNTHYVVAMQFIEGKPLNEVLANDGPVSRDDVVKLCSCVSEAIAALWELRIVHRDIKPSNIMVGPDGEGYLIDLGVARHVSKTTLTAAGATWGTFGYLSPEQHRAVKQLTCKSDIYTLGTVVIEALLGKHPTNRDQLLLFAKRLHEKLPSTLRTWAHADIRDRFSSDK